MDLTTFRPLESARKESLKNAYRLKQMLCENELNVVTAESLTAGMISKTLVDIPLYGNVVYGGLVVYDTDAKRNFIGVNTEGVYSQATALQMAEKTLLRSRAMVSISVTGNAMPYPESKEMLGRVDIGVSLRLAEGISTSTKTVEICEQLPTNLCRGWKELHRGPRGRTSSDQLMFAPFPYTSMMADLVRFKTVSNACQFAMDVIGENLDNAWGYLPVSRADRYCQPSPIILARLDSEMEDGDSVSELGCSETSSEILDIY